MPSSVGCLLLCGSIALALGNAQKLPKGNFQLQHLYIELYYIDGYCSLLKRLV
ncbi:hypothetical protein FD755_021841 [Muntiacus reevesi]|uniref:Uncharacterized protein n=2 Tax=Muntiacus TaxID=9885 RepID=A0A5N3W4S8_MUNRE|nr:hypothetical protein FD754_020450 [Muntiacus muntjak]KAB0355333.1 hypothetical protein FD755_021841 [Muntiacus reevesi]